VDHAEIPFPKDLRMVAGNATAKSQADVNEKVSAITWWCDGNGPEDRTTRPRAALPRKTCSAHMQAILRFPDCVNPDKISDYTYAALHPGGRCPAPMKRMPSLRFSVRYDTRRAIPKGWNGVPPIKLACGELGEGYCFHGDFINGWYDDAAKNSAYNPVQSFRNAETPTGLERRAVTRAPCAPASSESETRANSAYSAKSKGPVVHEDRRRAREREAV
jgi:hypothetical protein